MQDFYTIKQMVLQETGKDFVNALHMPLEELDQRMNKQHKTMEHLRQELLKQNMELKAMRADLSGKTTAYQKKIELLEKQLHAVTLQYKMLKKTLEPKEVHPPTKKSLHD